MAGVMILRHALNAYLRPVGGLARDLLPTPGAGSSPPEVAHEDEADCDGGAAYRHRHGCCRVHRQFLTGGTPPLWCPRWPHIITGQQKMSIPVRGATPSFYQREIGNLAM